MPRRVISKYTRETLQFFGQPISYLLREQVRLLLIVVAITESAFSSSVISIPLYFDTLPENTNSFFASEFELPIILVVYYLLSLSTASFWGSISDRIGRRPLLIVGTALAGISFLPYPLVYASYDTAPISFWILLVSNALKGIASAMIAGPVLAMFADSAPERNHGETMGKFYLARSAGAASGFLIGGLAWDLFSGDSFYFFMLIMFSASVLYIFRFSEPKRTPKVAIELQDSSMNFKTDAEASEGGMNPFKAMLQSLQNKQFRKFAIAWLAYTTLIGAGGTYAPLILKRVTAGGIGASVIGFVFLIGVSIMGIIQPTLGKLSDNFGRKPFLVIGCVGTSLLVVLFAAILGLPPEEFINILLNPLSISNTKGLSFGLGVVIYVPHLLIVLLIFILLLSASAFGSASLALITDVTKEGNRGREMGFTQALMSTGSILGTVIGGAVFNFYGPLGVMAFCFGLSIIAVVIIVQFLYETSGFYYFTHKLM
ncbi:MAG: MFS transporter [Candidatus Hodarchaeales archaeon]|jgi:MFS family permease